MFKAESVEFGAYLTSFFKVHGKDLPIEAVNIWWEALCDHSLLQIKNAFRHWSSLNKPIPRPFDIISILRSWETLKDKPSTYVLEEEIKRLDKEYGAFLVKLAGTQRSERDFKPLFSLRERLGQLEVQLMRAK